MRQKHKTVLSVIGLILASFFLLAGRSAQWALDEWGNLNLDEILYTMTQPLRGTDKGIVLNYVVYAVIPAAAVLLAGGAVYAFLKRRRKNIPVIAVLLACTAVFGVFQTVRFCRKLGVIE